MRARLAILIAVFLLALAACGGNDAKPGSAQKNGGKAPNAGTIKIAALLPLSGSNAEAGANMLNAARLAADDLNAAGGVLGRHIEIVSGDDGCTAEMATAAAESILATAIVGVAGGYCSGAAIPASAVTDRKGIPYISMATNPALTDRGLRTVFRVTGRDDQQAAFAARFLAGPGGVKRLALLHDNSVYAEGLAELIRSANDELKLGMQVVFFDAITPGEADYRSTLTHITASGADTLYFSGYQGELGVILRQAKELGLPLRLIGGDATNDPAVIKAAGVAAEEYVATTAPLPQFLPSGEAFAQNYRQRFGQAPGPYTMYQYDSVRVLANAIFWAGSTDPKDIVEALRTTRHQGLTGEVFFDEKGDRQTAVQVTAIVRDGEFRPHKKLDARDNWVDG